MNTTKHNITNTAEPIKQGYKKTPVGIIPEDWEVKRLDQCFKHLRTYTFSRNELEYNDSEENIFNIHYGDIHSVFPNYHLNVHNDLNIIPTIINPSLNNPELLQNGDIIMADASEDYEGVGKSIELQNIQDKKLVAGTHTFALRPIFKIASYYGGYVFANWNVHKSLKRIATGISVYGLSKVNLAKIPLPIPPLPEQEAIADCLTTWDKGIEKLSALIASKKEQKKGLMQGLFSGELKVENGELVKVEDKENWLKGWKEVRLGDIGSFTSGNGFPIAEQGGKEGIPFYKVSDMNLKGNEYKMKISNNYLTPKQIERLKLKPILKPSIIFAKVGAAIFLERKRKAKFFLIDNNMMAFTPYKYNEFIKYVFDIIMLSKYAQVGALPSYNASDISGIKIMWPSFKEQTAIAEVLTTADKEIELLEQKLESFKTQKKGLMQVLLTGEKRLVES